MERLLNSSGGMWDTRFQRDILEQSPADRRGDGRRATRAAPSPTLVGLRAESPSGRGRELLLVPPRLNLLIHWAGAAGEEVKEEWEA